MFCGALTQIKHKHRPIVQAKRPGHSASSGPVANGHSQSANKRKAGKQNDTIKSRWLVNLISADAGCG